MDDAENGYPYSPQTDYVTYPEDQCDQVPAILDGTPDPPGWLTGTVWVDTNKNGQWDAGEPPLSGATADLLRDNADGTTTTFMGTTITAANGTYVFANLPAYSYAPSGDIAGDVTYRVRFGVSGLDPGVIDLAAAGGTYVFTTPQNATGDPTVDSAADPVTGITGSNYVFVDTETPNVNAGVYAVGTGFSLDKTSALGDTVPFTPGAGGNSDPLTVLFTVTNTGDEPLTISWRDATSVGPAVAWDGGVPASGSTGPAPVCTTDDGAGGLVDVPVQLSVNPDTGDVVGVLGLSPTEMFALPVDASVTCSGTLPAVGPGVMHTDDVQVTARGARSSLVIVKDAPFTAYGQPVNLPAAVLTVDDAAAVQYGAAQPRIPGQPDPAQPADPAALGPVTWTLASGLPTGITSAGSGYVILIPLDPRLSLVPDGMTVTLTGPVGSGLTAQTLSLTSDPVGSANAYVGDIANGDLQAGLVTLFGATAASTYAGTVAALQASATADTHWLVVNVLPSGQALLGQYLGGTMTTAFGTAVNDYPGASGEGVIPTTATVYYSAALLASGTAATSNTADTAWGDVTFRKVNEVGAPLEGTEFSVYTCLYTADDVAAAGATNPGQTAVKEGAANPACLVTADDPAHGNAPATVFTSDGNGLLALSGLRYSDYANGAPVVAGQDGYIQYYLVETKAHPGYSLLAKPFAFTVDDATTHLADLDTTATDTSVLLTAPAVDYSVTNTPANAGFVLPFAGGTGTGVLVIIGSLAGVWAIALVWRRRWLAVHRPAPGRRSVHHRVHHEARHQASPHTPHPRPHQTTRRQAHHHA
jgi:hypothetical protein